jgi:hypothetical protein
VRFHRTHGIDAFVFRAKLAYGLIDGRTGETQRQRLKYRAITRVPDSPLGVHLSHLS